MAKIEEQDNIESMVKDNKLPVAWVIFFVALIVWGVYYAASYTPCISGWTQDKVFAEKIAK